MVLPLEEVGCLFEVAALQWSVNSPRIALDLLEVGDVALLEYVAEREVDKFVGRVVIHDVFHEGRDELGRNALEGLTDYFQVQHE